MVARNLSIPHEFVCFTDNPAGLATSITSKPLTQEWQGWWNKIALFAPDAFPEGKIVLYFDLDLVITGPIDFMIRGLDDLSIIQGFRGAHDGFNSSVMAFRAGRCVDIYDRFASDPEGITKRFRGDQDWIYFCRPNAAVFPLEKIVSFKLGMNSNAWAWVRRWTGWKRPTRRWPCPPWLSVSAPLEASIIVFHGLPNPEHVASRPFGPFKKAPFVAEHWR